MSASTIIRSILTGLVAIFAFFITIIILSYILSLPQYSLSDISQKLGGVHVFLAIIISIVATSYFIFWNIEDSLRRNVKEYTDELINNLKKMNNEILVTYELIKELNSKNANNEKSINEIKERVIALEKLIVEILNKTKK
jgi:peptidoglycan hydrolase CwlO-like protein